MHRSRSFIGAAALIGAALPLSGCAVGPDFTTPDVAIAASWRAAADARLATRASAEALWWKTFQDATLDRLVELAYHQNLSLQVAGLRIVEARARYGVVTGMQYPQQQEAFGSAQAMGVGGSSPSTPSPIGNYGTFQAGFDAAWELDFWGKYRRGVEAEAASLLASVSDYHAAIVALTAEVARAYVEARTFALLGQQYEANAQLQQRALEIAESRFRHGATSELDPTQARVLLQSTRAAIPKYQADAQRARNALSTLLGRPAGSVDLMLDGPRPIPKAPARIAVGVPADILRRRPDIRSAELNAASQCARIGIAYSALYPSFTLLGTVGVQAATSTNGLSPPLSANGPFYTAGLDINWPLLNYGRLRNAVRVEDARFQELLVGYRDVVLKAAQEVEDAQVELLGAQKAMVFEEAAVDAASRAVELALASYEEGATDYQRVLDAERSLLQEQVSLTQTTASVATNMIALYKALGGGWELRQGQPFVPESTQRLMKERTNWGDVLSQPRSPESERAPAEGKP